MKKIITICAAILMTATVFAQSPNKMSYQAVIRNSSNALVTNSAVGMRISILQTTPSGTAVYVETQIPTTNTNGLVSIEIGGGTVVSGNFSTIDWANGPYFVKTETDPVGGTSYSITGTSQLLSVPYALHAKNTDAWQMKTDTVYTNYKVMINDNSVGKDLLLKVEGDYNPLISFNRTNSTTYVDREWWVGTSGNGSFRIVDNTSVQNRLLIDTNGKTTINDVMNITPRATAPSSPSKGDIYFDNNLNKLRVYDGTIWQNCW